MILVIIENFILKIKNKAHNKNNHEENDKDTNIKEQPNE